MPTDVRAGLTEGDVYGDPFLGPVDFTDEILIDISGLTTDEVDTDGYLKPGVPFDADGLLIARQAGHTETYITGGSAGAHTVTGIKTKDRLVLVYNETDDADLTSEFSISAADEIDNTGGTDTTGDTLRVVYEADEVVHGVSMEAIRIGYYSGSWGNTATILANATDRRVGVAMGGVVLKAVVEDNLGRSLTAAEISAFGGKLKLLE